MARPAPVNNLLGLLRPADLARLEPHFSTIQADAGTVLYEPGDDVRLVHFPLGPTLVSFLVPVEGGQTVETALIGREGAVGGIVSQGRLPAFARTVVQYPGALLRLETARLEEAKRQSPALDKLFARYADCLLAQIFQSVACSAAHNIEQRTARWLLSTMDRTDDPRVPVTQERLADLLGVGRSYVSRVLAGLKAAAAIETGHGRITIADPSRLNTHACGCNAEVQRHFELVLQHVYPEAGNGAKS